MRKILDHIAANLDGKLTVSVLADLYGRTGDSFTIAFIKETGLPPSVYVRQRRLERAKALLTSTEDTMTDIATAVGMCDSGHFSRMFTQAVGVAPSVWRAEHAQCA